MVKTVEVDTLIIGAGPGGYVAGIRASQLGQEIVIVDKAEVGGVCLNRGCIPSKALISASHRYEQIKNGKEIGVNATNVQVDFSEVQIFKGSVVNKQINGLNTLLHANKVNVVKGTVSFNNEREVVVNNGDSSTRYQFKNGIIATGSRPIELRMMPFGNRILSSTEALTLQEIPNRLVVIGGGYIGVELGQMYAKFGAKVSIIEGTDTILPGFDKDMTRLVVKRLRENGVEIYTNAMANRVIEENDAVRVTFSNENKEIELESDYVLVTVGRRPNTDGDLGLEKIGVALTEQGFIDVDEQCRTSLPHIYAIGDVIKGPALAHKASYEGKVVAEAIAGLPSKIDYKSIPLVVFSDPECASVGMTADEARKSGHEVKVSKFPFSANGRALALNEPEGFVKLVTEKNSGLVIGAQIVGVEASNIIAELGLAIEAGVTNEDLALTIHAHPTLGELIMDVADASLNHKKVTT